MRFIWKLISLVAVTLAISLSVGGYSVIRTAFHSRLDAELMDAQEDMRMFSLTVQAVCGEELRYGEEDAAMSAIRSAMLQDSDAQGRTFRIENASGRSVGNMDSALRVPFEAQAGVIETRIRTLGGKQYVLSSQKLAFYGNVLYLQRSREISKVFTQADEALSRYSQIMVLILLLGVGATSVMAVYLTRPIRRISRTAKQFSAGHYDKRTSVQGSDELGQLAQTFDEMADALEQKIRALADAAQRQKDFTASFAHELKTPLTSVIGYADTLRSRVLPQEQQLQAVNYIFYEGKRLEAMSFALLDLFALEREAPRFRSVSSSKLLNELHESCRFTLEQQQMHLELLAQEHMLFVVPELLQTLLYNLIDNARKASKSGDTIYLTGELTPQGYRFCVRDTGCGIPKEALERLTEPFYMVNKSRARAQGGAGLGLALCQKIAELHKTQLVFESELGKGTSVSIVLGGEEIVCEANGYGLPSSLPS